VIWAVVAAIQVAVILGTSEEPDKALQPFILGIAVPAVLYALGWVVERLRRKT
jgi:cytochrome bd-type quinol oxidase subunit 1